MSIFGKKPTTTKPVVRTYHDKVCDNGYVTINGLTMAEANLHLSSSVSSDKLISALIYFFAEGSTVEYRNVLTFFNEKGEMSVNPACKLVGSGHPLEFIWTEAGSSDATVYQFNEKGDLFVSERRIKGPLGREYFENFYYGEESRISIETDNGDIEVRFSEMLDLSEGEIVHKLEDAILGCQNERGSFEWARELNLRVKKVVDVGNKIYCGYNPCGAERFSCTYEENALVDFVYLDGSFMYCFGNTGYSIKDRKTYIKVEDDHLKYDGSFDGASEKIVKMISAFNQLMEKYGSL